MPKYHRKREDIAPPGAEHYWMRARCGDYVFDVADPRHVARLNGISGNTAFVCFAETGYRGEIKLHEMRKAAREDWPT